MLKVIDQDTPTQNFTIGASKKRYFWQLDKGSNDYDHVELLPSGKIENLKKWKSENLKELWIKPLDNNWVDPYKKELLSKIKAGDVKINKPTYIEDPDRWGTFHSDGTCD